MKKLVSVLTVLAVTLPLAAAAQGRGRGPGRWGGGGWMRGAGPMAMNLSALELTDAQREKIDELRADLQTRLVRLGERLDVLRTEMAALWRARRPDRKAILAKHDEMDEVRRRMRVEGVDFRLAVMDLLTSEQLDQLRTMRGGKAGWGRGMGPCGRGMGWGRRGW